MRNEGTTTASSVSLKLPIVPIAEVKKEGTERKVHSHPEVLDLGDLQPGQEVSVYAWVDSLFGHGDAKEIRVSHASGVGRIVVRETASPFWVWMDRSWGFVAYLVLFVAAIVFLITSWGASRSKR